MCMAQMRCETKRSNETDQQITKRPEGVQEAAHSSSQCPPQKVTADAGQYLKHAKQ